MIDIFDIMKYRNEKLDLLLRLNAIKNTPYIRKCFKLKLLMIISLMKNIDNIDMKLFFAKILRN